MQFDFRESAQGWRRRKNCTPVAGVITAEDPLTPETAVHVPPERVEADSRTYPVAVAGQEILSVAPDRSTVSAGPAVGVDPIE